MHALQEYLICFDHKFINKCAPVWKIKTLLMIDILCDIYSIPALFCVSASIVIALEVILHIGIRLLAWHLCIKIHGIYYISLYFKKGYFTDLF